MKTFDPDTLRDPVFRQQFDAKMAEIQAVKAQHTYVGYAANRNLFDELVAIYEENLRQYTFHFSENLSAFQKLKTDITSRKPQLHPSQYEQLLHGFPMIEEKLASDHYATNAEAAALISKLTEKLILSTEEMAAWNKAYSAYDSALQAIKTTVWAEFYEEHLQAYKQLKAPGQLIGPSLPQLPEEATETATADRKEKTEALLAQLAKKAKLAQQVKALEGQYYAHKDFELLQQQLLKKLKISRRLKMAGWGVLFVLVGSLGFMAPFAYIHFTEGKSWTSAQTVNTWEAYQAYLDAYPEGQYLVMAQEAMLLLPYGKVSGLSDREGSLFEYEGELDAGIPQGQGKAIFKDGNIYEGSWKLGQFWGQGHLAYADGSSYTGEWEQGKRYGNGSFDNGQGDTYTGAWVANQRYGQGTLLMKDGAKYMGQWKQGLPDGEGRYTAGKGGGNEAFGTGWVVGSSYSGNWKAGNRHGKGTMRWEDGRVFQGNWLDNEPHGTGTLTWKEGSRFEGIWVRGKVDGEGTFLSKFREEDMGIWKGIPDAITLYDHQGVLVKRGRWEKGLFISE